MDSEGSETIETELPLDEELERARRKSIDLHSVLEATGGRMIKCQGEYDYKNDLCSGGNQRPNEKDVIRITALNGFNRRHYYLCQVPR